MHLPDVNVWLALAFEAHVHHPAAAAWFRELGEGETVAFCRVTQQGFLRLATNPSVFGPEALSLDQAWQAYDALLSDDHVRYIGEAAALESDWRAYTASHRYSHRVWTDAYLAAFARSGSLKLVSFDPDFQLFPGLESTLLSAEPAP